MIFVRDKGQMCNNMLQYAHLYAWGREHGRKTMSMRFAYKYRYFKICDSRYHNFLMYLIGKWGASMNLLPCISFDECSSPKEVARQLLLHRHCVAQGWYARFYDLFFKYKHEIIDMFSFKPEIIQNVQSKMQPLADNDCIRLGVHIRRGDYARWQGGKYFFTDDEFALYIKAFANDHTDKEITVFLSSNDASVSAETFKEKTGIKKVYKLDGNPAEDLCMLSECDFLIGPPSTFSLVAAMYHDIPLHRMMTHTVPTHLEFEKFDTLLKKII